MSGKKQTVGGAVKGLLGLAADAGRAVGLLAPREYYDHPAGPLDQAATSKQNMDAVLANLSKQFAATQAGLIKTGDLSTPAQFEKALRHGVSQGLEAEAVHSARKGIDASVAAMTHMDHKTKEIYRENLVREEMNQRSARGQGKTS